MKVKKIVAMLLATIIVISNMTIVNAEIIINNEYSGGINDLKFMNYTPGFYGEGKIANGKNDVLFMIHEYNPNSVAYSVNNGTWSAPIELSSETYNVNSMDIYVEDSNTFVSYLSADKQLDNTTSNYDRLNSMNVILLIRTDDNICENLSVPTYKTSMNYNGKELTSVYNYLPQVTRYDDSKVIISWVCGFDINEYRGEDHPDTYYFTNYSEYKLCYVYYDIAQKRFVTDTNEIDVDGNLIPMIFDNDYNYIDTYALMNNNTDKPLIALTSEYVNKEDTMLNPMIYKVDGFEYKDSKERKTLAISKGDSTIKEEIPFVVNYINDTQYGQVFMSCENSMYEMTNDTDLYIKGGAVPISICEDDFNPFSVVYGKDKKVTAFVFQSDKKDSSRADVSIYPLVNDEEGTYIKGSKAFDISDGSYFTDYLVGYTDEKENYIFISNGGDALKEFTFGLDNILPAKMHNLNLDNDDIVQFTDDSKVYLEKLSHYSIEKQDKYEEAYNKIYQNVFLKEKVKIEKEMNYGYTDVKLSNDGKSNIYYFIDQNNSFIPLEYSATKAEYLEQFKQYTSKIRLESDAKLYCINISEKEYFSNVLSDDILVDPPKPTTTEEPTTTQSTTTQSTTTQSITTTPVVTTSSSQTTHTITTTKPSRKSQIIKTSFSKKKLKISQIGKKYKLGVKAQGKVTYKLSNKKVVKMNKNGSLTIIGRGKVTITVKAASTSKYNSATKKITISVTGPKYFTYVTKGKLSYYKTPSTKSKIAGKLKKNVKVKGYTQIGIMDKKKVNWYKIQVNGKAYWAISKYLKKK